MHNLKSFMLIALSVLLYGASQIAAIENRLENGFVNPPQNARLHSYWWWLNGNVTKEAITRDLEAMKEKGFGGALIIDAGGANKRGNLQVPHGPDFASPEWRELFRHSLREATRLKLELALNIQSGWNLGGPCVTPADAAKILCWTETTVSGPGNVTVQLPSPKSRNGLLGEVAVVAMPDRSEETVGCKVAVSSAHTGYPASRLCDSNAETCWVSDGIATGKDALAWIRLSFDQKRAVTAITLSGRPRYGPKALEVFAIEAEGARRLISKGQPGQDGIWRAEFDQPQTVRQLEICVTDGYDPTPIDGKPRNVQIAEITVEGPKWRWPAPRADAIRHWEQKALYRPLHASAPDTSFLLAAEPENEDAFKVDPTDVIDVSQFVDAAGKLTWTAPEGNWRVYRFCYTVAPRSHVATCSEGWEGLAIDPMDAKAFQRYWDTVVEPLMQDAANIKGKALRYLHTDSWEIEPYNWTPKVPEEFHARCGYDMFPWLPVLGGRKVDGTEASNRFLHDFRKTVAALTAENYYGPFLENAHRHGLQVRAESGGPHAVPIDAQHCLGMIDVPMSEFWATSWRHRVGDKNRFFVKQPAMAAHTYGKRIVAAEGFTTIGPHWQERLWNNLKPAFDHALCEGLNQLVWTLITCSPPEMGMPGQEMHAGTHFNPNSTWWRQSEGLLSYVNRCQWMLQQGLFVGDVLYYYGDHSPNFAQLKASNPTKLPTGYDYDVATEHVILNRVSVKNGRMVLPDGMSYAALVLAPHRTISLSVLRKLHTFAKAGGVIVGVQPESSSGLVEWKKGDAEAKSLINMLWGKPGGPQGLVKYSTALEWLKSTKLPADFSVQENTAGTLDYIHRRDGNTDIYFLANRHEQAVRASVRFRIVGKAPELWNPGDGLVRLLPEFRNTDEGTTEVPLELKPYGSCFVVFRQATKKSAETRLAGVAAKNFPMPQMVSKIPGPWDVSFDPAWFYPDNGTGGKLVLEKLQDWSRHPDKGVRYFSGTAVYRTRFDTPETAADDKRDIFLSLGDVHEMARVRINGSDLGVVWCPPWSVQIPAGILKAKGNRLELEVVNFWPNRLIGDAKLPPEQRRTRTNITKFYEPKGDARYTTLMTSGLLGPVTLQMVEP